MSKITKLFLVICLLMSTTNFSYAESVKSETNVEVNGYTAKITGTADCYEGTEVSVMVVRPEKDIFSVVEDSKANKENLLNNNVVCIAETSVNDEKEFEFICNFDKGEKSGIYTLRVQVYGEAEVREMKFAFENSERIEIAKEVVKSNNFNELKTGLEEYATELDVSAGEEYITFSDKEKEYVLKSIIAETSDKEKEFVSSVEEIRIIHEMKTFDKEGLKEYIQKGDVVGVESSDVSEYSKLTSLKKDVLVADLYKRLKNVQTPDDLKNEFSKALSEIKKPAQTGGSTGGGGSSTGSFTVTGGYTPGQITDNNPYVIDIPQNEEFTDMENTPWAKEAVLTLYEKGVVNGKGENLFCPSDIVTREEFLKMIIESLNIIGISDEAKTFTDVNADAWYSHYVDTGVGCGIINGVSDTEFGIGQPIKREDMATMLYRAVKYAEVNLYEVSDVTFTDENDISEYAREAVLALSSAKVINGMSDGSFMPKKTATRAEAAVMLYNLLYR